MTTASCKLRAGYWPALSFATSALFACLALTVKPASAQSAPGVDNEPEKKTVVLSPFVVTADNDTGYRATTAQSGTRLLTDMRDIAGSVSVVTKDFMNDIGAVNLDSLLSYTLNTEVAGVSGNFSGSGSTAINGGTEVSFESAVQSQSVAPVTRIRGLTAADTTADFFTSGTPLDGYNIDRIEINRGPNAMLFGLGSPAGIINQALIKAQLTKTKTQLSFRTDQYGSFRTTLDHNDVLIKDKLAIRVAGVYSKDQYEVEQAFRENKRGYATFTYRPFKNTFLRASFENARIDSNNPRNNPPNDAYTWWWALGKPVYNAGTGTIALTSTPYDLPIPGSTSSPGTYNPITAAGTRNTNIITTAIGTVGLTNNMTLVYSDPDSDVLGIPGTNVIGFRSGQIANVHPNAAGTALQTDGMMGLADTARILNNVVHANDITKNFWKNYAMIDPSIYDFYHNMLEGPNKYEWAGWKTYNVTLEQQLFDGQGGVEIAYNRENLENGWSMPNYSQGAYALRIDLNQTLANGAPNPNFGRPLISGFAYMNAQEHDRDTARFTGYYNLNLQSVGPNWLGRILGHHRFTGTHTRYSVTDLSYGSQGVYNSGQDYAIANQGSPQDVSTQGRLVSIMRYVGPDASGSATPVGGLATIGQQTITNLQSAHILYYTSPASSAITNPPTQWEERDFQLISNPRESVENTMRNTSVTKRKTTINSTSIVAQDYLFNNTLVGTLGWRRDAVYTYDAGTPPKDPVTRVALLGPPWGEKFVSSASEDSFNWGAVLHSPEFINRWLPFGAVISLTYNHSDNFKPTGQRLDMFENPRGPERGKTSEYGVLLEAFHGKLAFKFTHYKTENVDSSSLVNLGTSISNLADSVADTLDRIANGMNGDPNDPSNPKYAGIQQFNQWLASPLGLQYQKTFQFAYDPATNSYNYSRRNNEVVEVADVSSTGEEYELTYNPLKNWRIAFNASRAEAIRTNSGLDLQTFMSSLAPVYNGPAGQLIVADNGSLFGDSVKTGALVPMLAITTQDGGPTSELREWHWNVITNYTFTDTFWDGKLKGWAIGGGVRWLDKSAIGSPVIVDPVAGPIPDARHPYYAPAQTNFDAWVSYSRKLGKVDLSVQLNVRNIGVGDKLIPVSAQPDGTYAAYTIAEAQTIMLNTTLSF
ncbi:MAG TPA: TonB-dependent receptor plug domain-containing protein [Opitutaceae bacterium]|nr:TonB-dependent receptor plug domain-containing protein [Opitutaceae bacterium]